MSCFCFFFFFFSSRRRHTRYWRDWSSDVCSSDLDRGDGSPAATTDHDAPANGPGNGSLARRNRSEEHTSELQSRQYLVCRLLLEKKKKKKKKRKHAQKDDTDTPCGDKPHTQ